VANDSYTTAEDTALVTTLQNGVLNNDTTSNATPISAEVVDQPVHGALSFNADGTFTFTPAANFHGTDSFTYTASDGVATSTLATVTITITSVNDAPVAVADTYDATPGNTLVVNQANGVLKNDSDVDGDAITAVLVTNPGNGSLTLNPDGSFNYTPTSGFSGTDSFTYKPNDGTVDGNIVTVTLNVVPPGGEGEGASIQDAALLDYLSGLNNSSAVSSTAWTSAVDHLMGQLG
jgi:VCBS repeat-containing protein